MTSKIYSLHSYKVSKETIENGFEEHDTSEIATLLEEDKGYHYRIEPSKSYIFYGDVDQKKNGKHTTWKQFREALIEFMDTEYDVKLMEQSFCYTTNSGKEGSFHYSIPELNAKAKTLQKIMKKFKLTFTDYSDFIDTTIYSKHWWRLPNQEVAGKTKHEVTTGKMIDFVIDFIPKKSKNIDYLVEEKVIEIAEEAVETEKAEEEKAEELNVIKKFFDECYNEKRYSEYEYGSI